MRTHDLLGYGGMLAGVLLALGCAGSDGAAGSQGPGGPAGTSGTKGDNGSKGDTGPKGDVGAKGDTGAKGAQGDTGAKGDKGDTPALVGTLTITVTDSATPPNPLAGVEVASVDGSLKGGVTDANGEYTYTNVPLGSYTLLFHAANWLDKTVDGVGVVVNATTNVATQLAFDVAGTPGPTIAVSGNPLAGYGTSVTLKATVTPGDPADKLTYQWKQTAGTLATLAGDTTASLTFTTRAWKDAKVVPLARFGMLGINPDEANHYTFSLTVTDDKGHTTTSSVLVQSTWQTAGLANVPIGIPEYLQGDSFGSDLITPQKTWNWTIDVTGAAGSKATVTGPTTQFPSFTPDLAGTYVLKESVANKTITVYAGKWTGVMDPGGQSDQDGCTGCHQEGGLAPAVFPDWKKTAHYSAAQRKMDGIATASFPRSCMTCHTVGDSPVADNGGFDDAEAKDGYKYPAKAKAGNWDDLQTNHKTVGKLAGIQCESCHGPQDSKAHPKGVDARRSWSAEVCASCHQESPHHYFPGQWSSAGHSNLELALEEATWEGRGTTSGHCGRCHSAQGFAQYATQLAGGYTGVLTKDGKPEAACVGVGCVPANRIDQAWATTNGLTRASVQPQTCAACHDPHDATNPAQLRIYDTAPAGLPNGMGKITNAGTGLICMTCHNTRNGEHSDFVAKPSATSFSASHVPAQTDVLYGFNAYWVPRYNPSAHLAVGDTCVGCHVKTPTATEAAAGQTGNHAFKTDTTICASCHAAGVNGEALQASYQAQLDALGADIATEQLASVQVKINSEGGVKVSAWNSDPALGDYYTAKFDVAVLPVTVEHFEIHGQMGWIWHMANAYTAGLVDGAGNPVLKNGQPVTITTKDLYIRAGDVYDKPTGKVRVFDGSSNLMLADWNWWLLVHDGTKGVHNPGFYTAVIAATSTKIGALGCSDTLKNWSETDVDCGGPVCGKCAAGKACASGGDCASGTCTAKVCQ